MPRKTISDWIKLMQKIDSKTSFAFSTDKLEDMARLRATDLPQFDWFECPYFYFKRDNKKLMDFINKYVSLSRGFCVRAIPNEKGRERGFTRKPKRGYLKYLQMSQFLAGVIKGNMNFYSVGLSEWEEQIYGGTLIINRGDLLIELLREEKGGLEALSHGANPDASFCRIEEVISQRGNKEEKDIFSRVLKEVQGRTRGYFEFVITKKGKRVVFVDYKLNRMYWQNF